MTKPLGRNDTTAGSQQQHHHQLNSQALSEGAVPSTINRPKLKRTSSFLFNSKQDQTAVAAVVHHSIQLPSGIEDRITGDTGSPILSHVWNAASTGSTMCLVASVKTALTHENITFFLYTLGWAATLLWVCTIFTDQQQQHLHGNILLSWALFFSIFTAIHFLSIYYRSAINLSHLAIPAAFLFFFARNVHISYTQLQVDTRQRIQDQVKATQSFVNQSTDIITSTRLQLLEHITQEMKGAASIITSTLEHFTPAHRDELLSACTISVPVTSISAIHTAIKQVNHINSNIGLITGFLASENGFPSGTDVPPGSLTRFDIGELVQSVVDALAGMAASLAVHLVFYHMDNTPHYNNIVGNEGIMRHTLLNLLSRIMEEGSTPGATIEVGLGLLSLPPDDAFLKRITLEIIHTCSPAIPATLKSVLTPNSRFAAQLMHYMGGDMTVEEIERGRTRFCLTVNVQAASCENDDFHHRVISTSTSQIHHNQFTDMDHLNEPTRKDLELFIEKHLKCLKMVLYAPEQSVFATHFTRYLTNLNADISHIPITHFPTQQKENDQLQTSTPTGEAIVVLIDDDVLTLERLLHGLRSPHPPPSSASSKGAQQKHHTHHRRHGSKGSHSSFGHPTGVIAIICFGSLNKYKQLRKVVQLFASQNPFAMPRVIVIPKPASPLRFLTALHTAWYNPVAEPHSFPIATSPLSPMTVFPTDPLTSGPTASSESRNQRGYSPASGNEPSFSSRRQQQQQQQQQHQCRLSPAITSSWADQHYFSLHEATLPNSNIQDNNSTRLRSLSGTLLMKTGVTRLDTLATPLRGPQDTFGDYSDGEDDHTGHLAQGQEKTLALIEPFPGHTDETSGDIKDITAVGNNPGGAAALSAAKTPPIASGNPMEPSRPTRRFMQRKKKRDKHIPFSGAVSPPINVLIVEDNKINQVILQTWMKRHNIKHSSATNGQEAVEKWKEGEFHLVLMDIQLPIMSGIDATKTIRSIERKQHIGVVPATGGTSNTDNVSTTVDAGPSSPTTPFRSPVIIVALTASSLESDRHAALTAGCNDFLTKPVSLEWLEKKIVEWGCMQALIDFEGWRRWRKSTTSMSSNPNTIAGSSSASPPSPPPPPKTRTRRMSRQKESWEDQAQNQARPSLISNSQRPISIQDGILLPGVGGHHGRLSKRNASMDDGTIQRGEGGEGGNRGGLTLG